jgi:hypothetical protein
VLGYFRGMFARGHFDPPITNSVAKCVPNFSLSIFNSLRSVKFYCIHHKQRIYIAVAQLVAWVLDWLSFHRAAAPRLQRRSTIPMARRLERKHLLKVRRLRRQAANQEPIGEEAGQS